MQRTSQPAPARALTLMLLAATFAVHFLDRQLLAILIPAIKSEFELSDTALGLLSGIAFTLFYSTFGLVIAWRADRANRARIITWSLFALSVMTAACGLAQAPWQLFAARMGVGIGESGTNPASHSLIADLYAPHERATAMATYAIGPHVGLMLAFGFGGWISHAWGWRMAFMVAGAMGLALVLVASLALRDLPRDAAVTRPDADRPSDALAAMLGSTTLRHLLAGGILATGATMGMVTWLPAMLMRSHGSTVTEVGLFLAVAFGLAGAAGTYALGRLADVASINAVRRKSYVVAGCQAVTALLLGLALLTAERSSALLLLFVPCALMGAYVGPSLALIQDVVDPRHRALAAAVALFLINLLGATLGPLLVGASSDVFASWAGPNALRYSLLAMPLLLLWSAAHFALAAPTLSEESHV